jgi:hypothetical protein
VKTLQRLTLYDSNYSFYLLNHNIADACWSLLIHKNYNVQLETIDLVQFLLVDEDNLMKDDVWCYYQSDDKRAIQKLIPLVIWHLQHTSDRKITRGCVAIMFEYVRQKTCDNILLQLVERIFNSLTRYTEWVEDQQDWKALLQQQYGRQHANLKTTLHGHLLKDIINDVIAYFDTSTSL